MTTAPPRAQLVRLSSGELARRLYEALEVYLEAMGYPAGTARQRGPLWLEHRRRPGWQAVGAVDPAGALVGIGYGYSGAPGQWWYHEVQRGLAGLGRAADTPNWLANYFELTELHVHPRAQGAGIGEGMLRALMASTDRRNMLLSTPEEVAGRRSRAWLLYRRLGFVDVLRSYRFAGDPRPFAVLGRTLPFTEATGTATGAARPE
ncbi:MAG: GNAT family N-acetyltransferase [Pseudonocardia sp.]